MKKENQGQLIHAYLLTDSAPKHKLAFKYLAAHVFGAILNQVNDKSRAEDVFQDLCLILWDQIRSQKLSYQGESAFFRYIHSTWKHIWLNTYAREKRYVALEELKEFAEEPSQVADQEPVSVLRRSLKFLNNLENFLVYSWSTGASWKDIEEEVNADLPLAKHFSNVSLRMRHSRAMKKLKKVSHKLRIQMEK